MAINTEVTGVKVNGKEEVRENKSKGILSRRVEKKRLSSMVLCPFTLS